MAEPDRRRADWATSALKTLAALALGGVGGWIFYLLRIPLPWMLGSLSFTMVAALLGAKLHGPPALRNGLIALLGIMIGSGFTASMLLQAGEWLISLAAILAYIGLTATFVFAYLRRYGGYDRVTSYFMAMPGGLNEMTAIGHAMGGDDRAIALSHAWRMIIVVFTIPLSFRLFAGYMPPAVVFSGGFAQISPLDWTLLVACGLLGTVLGKRLRLPAPFLTGSMALSALIHVAGLTAFRVPPLLVLLAQIGIGSGLGARFAGVRPRTLGRIVFVGTGAALMMLANTALCSVVVGAVTGLPVAALLLAYAPGGLAEMSIVALSLGIDAPFVSTHQLTRILLVIFIAPLFFRLLPRGLLAAAPADD
jgi:membrane AbrB-like protein